MVQHEKYHKYRCEYLCYTVLLYKLQHKNLCISKSTSMNIKVLVLLLYGDSKMNMEMLITLIKNKATTTPTRHICSY